MKAKRKPLNRQTKSCWARPKLEELEPRVVLNAALDGLKAGLPGLSTGLSGAFGQATSSLLSGTLPFAPLITSTVLSNQVDSVVSSVESTANSASTVTQLLGE